MGLVLGYAAYADLGVVLAASRAIPLQLGSGKADRTRDYYAYALGAALTGSLVVSGGIFTFVLVRQGSLSTDLQFGLLMACFLVALQAVVATQQVVMRARRLFGLAAFLAGITSLGNLLGGVIGANAAGVKGVLVGQAVSLTLAVALGFAAGGPPALVRPRWVTIARLLRSGIPLNVLQFGAYGLVYIDQIMVLFFLGRRDLGIYTIVLYVGAALHLLPVAVGQAMTPRLLSRYGEHGTLESIEDLAWKPVQALSTVLPVVVLILWIVFPIMILHFLPLYADSIGPLRLYLIGGYFLGLTVGTGSPLLAIGKYHRNIPVVLVAIGLNAALDILLLGVLDLGLMGASLGSATTYFLYWTANHGLVRWHFDRAVLKATMFNLKMGWPGLLLAIFGLLSWQQQVLSDSRPSTEIPVLGLMALGMAMRWRHLKIVVTVRPSEAR